MAEKYFDLRIFWTLPSAKPPRGSTHKGATSKGSGATARMSEHPQCCAKQCALLVQQQGRQRSLRCVPAARTTRRALRSRSGCTGHATAQPPRAALALTFQVSVSMRYSRRSGTVRGSRSRCSTALFRNIQRLPRMVQLSSAPVRAVRRCGIARGRVRGWWGSRAVCTDRSAFRDATV